MTETFMHKDQELSTGPAMTGAGTGEGRATAEPSARDQGGPAMSDSIETMYLTFPVGNELYAVSIKVVTEIVGMQRIMSVPDVPHYIKGVINLRGKVIPLMDVRLRFGMPEKEYDDRTVVIVLEVAGAPVGLIVDGVAEVLDIPDDLVDRPNVQTQSAGKSLVKGLGRLEDRVAILLDVAALLEAENATLIGASGVSE